MRPKQLSVLALTRAERRRNARDFEIRPSRIEGRGLFARRAMPAGGTLNYVGELLGKAPRGGKYTVVHGGMENVFVVPPARCRPYAAYANHDADGALHWVFGGDYPLLQLRRAVRAGEELCVDYGKGACV